VGLFTAFPQYIHAAKQRDSLEVEIDKSKP